MFILQIWNVTNHFDVARHTHLYHTKKVDRNHICFCRIEYPTHRSAHTGVPTNDTMYMGILFIICQLKIKTYNCCGMHLIAQQKQQQHVMMMTMQWQWQLWTWWQWKCWQQTKKIQHFKYVKMQQSTGGDGDGNGNSDSSGNSNSNCYRNTKQQQNEGDVTINWQWWRWQWQQWQGQQVQHQPTTEWRRCSNQLVVMEMAMAMAMAPLTGQQLQQQNEGAA